MMRHFLILFDTFPIDKKSVKAGDNSPQVIVATRCVNVGLFISGDLRRDVIVSIAFGTLDDLIVISFPGEELRRVSPDERSISFFLLKATIISDYLEMNSQEIMDNGIEVSRMQIGNFLERINPRSIFISNSDTETKKIDAQEYSDSVLIWAQRDIFDLDSIESKWTKKGVPYYPQPERFILDINMINDRINS